MDKNVIKCTMGKKEFIAAMEGYKNHLILSEYSIRTMNKYISDLGKFMIFLEKQDTIQKQTVIAYKNYLKIHYKISSVNSYLISLNKFFKWNHKEELTVRIEKIQHKSSMDKVISKEEYQRLMQYLSISGKTKDYLLVKTLSLTGIRIGELKFITYHAVVQGVANVTFKGKTRVVYISDNLSSQLLEYCNKRKIYDGIIFYGRDTEKALDASGVWKKLKRIAERAGISKEVMYPHSFRHYFAKSYMDKIGNIMELADILGHSSIEMTRIYTMTSAQEKRSMLNQLDE